MMRILQRTMVLVLLSVAVPAQSQCALGDDGFDLGCCAFVQPNLPAFPLIQIAGKQGCLRDCQLEAEHPVAITLQAPNFITCDLATIQIAIIGTGPSGPYYGGVLIAKYSRTWLEAAPGFGGPRQVWRFLVNGELMTTLGAPITGCPVPLSALNTNGSVHFFGSIDYACEPGPTSGTYRVRLDLNHGPACLQHAPWTAHPGAHPASAPDRSYHVVAPQSFTFAPVMVPDGAAPGEAVRASAISPVNGYACFSEADVGTNTFLNTVGQNCLCLPSVSTPPALWTHQSLNGFAFCAGVAAPFTTVPLPGTPFPTGFVTLSLGHYDAPATGAVFPYQRDLLIHWGVIDHVNPCAPNNFRLNVVHGVTTSGHQGTVFGSPVTTFMTFMDLANHKDPAAAFVVPGGLPIFGATSYADLVFNLNL